MFNETRAHNVEIKEVIANISVFNIGRHTP